MSLTYSTIVDSPIGKLQIVASDIAICEIRFESQVSMQTIRESSCDGGGLLREAEKQLRSYFAGDLTDFDLPLQPAGTDFQKRVWQELTEIPYGTTTSYGVIAARIGSPKASRAVGAANGKNPIPIIVPCHRVIGQNGTLTGFGGGLPIKKQLLELERAASSLLRLELHESRST